MSKWYETGIVTIMDAPIADYISTRRSGNTQRVYRTALKHFLDYISPDGGTGYEERAQRYLQAIPERAPHQDIMGFISHLEEEGRPPKTVQMYSNPVLNWLEYHRIELPRYERRQVTGMTEGAAPETEDRPLTREMIQKIHFHAAPGIQCLILVLASSGMRVGEALQLTDADLDWTYNPPRVRILHKGRRTTKSRKTRYAFVSTEAAESLKTWMQYRFNNVKHTPKKYQKKEDKRIFPFKYDRALIGFATAAQKAGYDERDETTNRALVHIHGLRKYFRTNLPRGGAAEAIDMTRVLMGEWGYLDQNYVRHLEESLHDFYKTAQQNVWIVSTVPILPDEDKERIEQQDRRIKELESMFKDLRDELTANLEKRLEALKR